MRFPQGGKFQGGTEGGVRVPTIIRLPGVIEEGITVNEPTSQMDVVPTITEILGLRLPVNKTIDGVSLVPLLKKRKPKYQGRTFIHYCGQDIHAVRYKPEHGKKFKSLKYTLPELFCI